MKLNKDSQTLDQIAPLVEYSFLKTDDLRQDANLFKQI